MFMLDILEQFKVKLTILILFYVILNYNINFIWLFKTTLNFFIKKTLNFLNKTT